MSCIFTKEELMKKKNAELKIMCKEQNLKCTGNKSVLVGYLLGDPTGIKLKKKAKKKSGYTSLFYDGTNKSIAEIIGNYITSVHSTKISAGNQLEDDIYADLKTNSTLGADNCHHKKTVRDLSGLQHPCVISKCKFPKSWYDEHGQTCKNKQYNEIDFLGLGKKQIDLAELKSGCDFDTKKSKGEVQSLIATKNALEKTYPDKKVNCYIVCYDAEKLSDIKLKTNMGAVKPMLYEDYAAKIGLNGANSRERITTKEQKRAKSNIEALEKFISTIKNIPAINNDP